MRHRLTDAAFGVGWRLTKRLPRSVAEAAFSAGGDLAATSNGAGVRRLRANLARVVPEAGDKELDELVRKAVRSYARYWRETFQLPRTRDDVVRRFGEGVIGAANVDAGLRAGNGVIVALPHSGNWDAVGLWLASTYGPTTAVVERLEPERLYRRFAAFRESLGVESVPLRPGRAAGNAELAGRECRTRGAGTQDSRGRNAGLAGRERGTRPADVLIERLRGNRVLCLLADRDLTGNGVDVDFFGGRARMPAGPAWLAARTSAALVPMTTWFTDDGWGAKFHPRIRVTNTDEVPAATQRLADVFAGAIAAHPADWHMLQPVWRDESQSR